MHNLNGLEEAILIVTACNDIPARHENWNLRILAGKYIQLGVLDSILHESVRRIFKEELKPWQQEMLVFKKPTLNTYLEDVVYVYELTMIRCVL